MMCVSAWYGETLRMGYHSLISCSGTLEVQEPGQGFPETPMQG